MSNVNLHLVGAILSITLGSGFHHGFNTGVTNILQQRLIGWINATEAGRRNGTCPNQNYVYLQWAFLVGSWSIGAVIGSSFTHLIAIRRGRKFYMMWNNVILFVGTLLSTIAKPASCYELLTVGRCIVGVHSGLNCGLAILYLVEIAPTQIRGAVASCYYLMMTVGLFTSQMASVVMDSDNSWPYVFLVPVLPAILQMCTLPLCPESPVYLLVLKDDEAEALKSIRWLRKRNNVQKEMNLKIFYDSVCREIRPMSCTKLHTNPNVMLHLFVCAGLMVSRHLCGISNVNVPHSSFIGPIIYLQIIYYSMIMFDQVGFTKTESAYFTCGLSIMNILVGIVSLFLVDFFGRRKMLLFSFFGLTLDTVLLVILLVLLENTFEIKYVAYTFSLLFVSFYAVGAGPICLFYPIELFHHTLNSLVMSLVVPLNWISIVITVETFLPLT